MYRRSSRVSLALVAALLLLTLAASGADARLPRARAYHVGGPITLDTNLLSVSGATAWSIDAFLAARTPLPPLGAAFLAAERKYGVNARFLLAVALHESGFGRSAIARVKHNLFGLNAYDRDPLKYASAYASYAASVDDAARYVKTKYLSAGGRFWTGQPTLRSMQQFYSSSGKWGVSISRVASSIRLASFDGSKIAFAAPVVGGLIHTEDEGSVSLSWKGGTIPERVRFAASWEPIVLDADLIAGGLPPVAASGVGGAAPELGSIAAPSQAAPALGGATTDRGTTLLAGARRTPTTAGLAVHAPAAAGRYVLHLEATDSDGRPLPPSQRMTIPDVEVHVWADRAISYSISPDVDGTGAVVEVTNTGRAPIPAQPVETSTEWRDRGAEPARSVITVLATPSGPWRSGPVLLAESPLTEDLAPGASVAIDVPGIAAITGRPTAWLTVALDMPGDPAWLKLYPALGAQFPVSSDPGGPVPPTSPIPAPTPGPAPIPPAIEPPSPPPPSEPITTTFGEHAGAIVYHGSWGDARNSRYLGGNVAWSKSAGATATFTFTGSTVRWIGPAGPTRGRASVVIDGQRVGQVDMWRSSFSPRALLFERSFGSVGTHTLTITVLSTPSHPYVAIDAFEVVSRR